MYRSSKECKCQIFQYNSSDISIQYDASMLLLFGVTLSRCLLSSTRIKHINPYNDFDSKFVCKVLKLSHVDNYNSGSENVLDAFDFS